MPRRSFPTQQAVKYFLGLPRQYQIALLVAALVVGLIWLIATQPRHPSPGSLPSVSGTNPDGSGTYLFCFWNLENLFDDRDDRRREADETYDGPFAHNTELRQQKYSRMAQALLRLNGGRGPDLIAGCEVESVRAAELLRDALNQQLTEQNSTAEKYQFVAMKDLNAGRHIAPCVIARVPVANPRLHGSQLRILEVQALVNGHDLTLIASHWTSQLRQADGSQGESGRQKYATTIRGLFEQLARRDPRVDVLICGDFNTTPESDPLVQGLKATGERSRVHPGADSPLLNLMAGKPADRFGTHWYNSRPLIYDQLVVSPGLLDPQGWSCDPESVATITAGLTQPGAKHPRPWRFDSPDNPPTGGRGYSDHFPVVVTLRVAPPGGQPVGSD